MISASQVAFSEISKKMFKVVLHLKTTKKDFWETLCTCIKYDTKKNLCNFWLSNTNVVNFDMGLKKPRTLWWRKFKKSPGVALLPTIFSFFFSQFRELLAHRRLCEGGYVSKQNGRGLHVFECELEKPGRLLFSGNVKAANTLHVKQSLIKSRKPKAFFDRGLAWSRTLIVHAVFDTFGTWPVDETNHYL